MLSADGESKKGRARIIRWFETRKAILMVSKKVHLAEHEDYWRHAPTLSVQLNRGRFLERQEWILKNLSEYAWLILDCGCNDGAFTRAIASTSPYPDRGDLKRTVVGIDILPRNIALAKKIDPNGNYLVMDIEKLKFGSYTFDSVILTETLEHLRRPKKALKEIHRVLTITGTVLISVPNGLDAEPTHYNTFTIDSLKEMMHRYFVVEKLEATPDSIYAIGRKVS